MSGFLTIIGNKVPGAGDGGGGGGDGDVVGPGSSTVNAIVVFADSSGKVIKEVPLLVDVDGDVFKLIGNIDFTESDGSTQILTIRDTDVIVRPDTNASLSAASPGNFGALRALNGGLGVELDAAFGGSGRFQGDLTVDGTIKGIFPGHAQGFLVRYKDSTHIDIDAGVYETDSKRVELNANATDILISSIPSGFDLIYVYLDKSASGPTSPSFYDDVAEPVKNLAKRGWYHPTNTTDRVVGVVPTPSTGAILMPFQVLDMGGHIRQTFGGSDFSTFAIATTLAANGTYKAPNIRESSVVCPVNSTELLIEAYNTYGGIAFGLINVSNFEYATINTTLAQSMIEHWFHRERGMVREWLALGASRNIRLGGNVISDNNLYLVVYGYGYDR